MGELRKFRTATVRVTPSVGTNWATSGTGLTSARSVTEDCGCAVMQVQPQPWGDVKPGAAAEQRSSCGASLMEHAHGNAAGTAKDATMKPAASRRCSRDTFSTVRRPCIMGKAIPSKGTKPSEATPGAWSFGEKLPLSSCGLITSARRVATERRFVGTDSL